MDSQGLAVAHSMQCNTVAQLEHQMTLCLPDCMRDGHDADLKQVHMLSHMS